MYSLVCLAALVIVVTSQGPQILKCDPDKFKTCTALLAQHLQGPFTDTNVWLDDMLFRGYLNQIFTSGDITANVKICNALQMFYSCLEDYRPICLGVHGLVGQNMDPYMAYGYEGFMNMWRFQCGAGFYGSQKTGADQCIRETIQHMDDQLKPLLDSYRSNVEHDPSIACKYAFDLSRGHKTVFSTGPCSTSHAQFGGWWGCEGQNEYSIAQFPECGVQNQCDYQSVTTKEEAAKYVKFVDGKMMVKIGPTWKKNEKGEWHEEPEKWI